MNRICLTSIAVLGMTLTSQVLAESEKPNVLFLIADDLNTALSGFGHKQCKTPNLDRLAERGVKFENMHCQYPVCGASRASIMSGLYPYSNLTLGNAGTLRGSMPNVVVLWGSPHPHASHSGKNYPLHLAGGNALGFMHGNLHAFEGARKVPLANLFVSMLNAVDVPVKQFADSTGAMTELRG